MKNIITILLTICVLLSSIVTINAIEIPYTEIETIENDDNNEENDLQPMMASSCDDDPLEYYFGNDYNIYKKSGPWIYVEGANGIKGGYNTSTGVGYVEFSDGTRQDFEVHI